MMKLDNNSSSSSSSSNNTLNAAMEIDSSNKTELPAGELLYQRINKVYQWALDTGVISRECDQYWSEKIEKRREKWKKVLADKNNKWKVTDIDNLLNESDGVENKDVDTKEKTISNTESGDV